MTQDEGRKAREGRTKHDRHGIYILTVGGPQIETAERTDVVGKETLWVIVSLFRILMDKGQREREVCRMLARLGE